MQATLRSCATASAALAAAGVIAVTPVTPLPSEAVARAASPAVALTAFDPLTPWLEVFNDTEVNIAGLVNYWLEAPLPTVQQVASNWIYYLGHLDTLGQSLQQIADNAVAAIEAPFVADQSLLDATHKGLYSAIVAAAPDLEALVSFTASPLSGLLVGFVGNIISPFLALSDSIHATFGFIADGEWEDALNELVNIPAAMTGAVLNGYGQIDLSALIPLLQDQLPVGTITELNLAMGGLFSPAGSLLNSIGMKVTSGPPLNIPLLSATGVPAGFIGTLLATGQAIAKAIGWDGNGNPLAPPLSPPYGDDSELAAAADVPASVTDPEAAAVVAVSQDTTATPAADAVADGSEEEVAADTEGTAEAGTEGTEETAAEAETDGTEEAATEAVADTEGTEEAEAAAEAATEEAAEEAEVAAEEAEVAAEEAEGAAEAGTESEADDEGAAADTENDAADATEAA